MPERIMIGADHAGFEMKSALVAELIRLGYEVDDVGTDSTASVDYPDFAHPVARAVSAGEVRRGVLLCGTGLGMSYAANRHRGVRAAVVWSTEVARLAREHNDANILVLPSRCIDDATALEILHAFLDTPYAGGRHDRRIAKIEVPT
jgi:ribose 5-phosphate isomerase B